MLEPFARALPRNRFLRGCSLLLRRYFRHDVARDSAALAYYLLFTLFPFLIFISSLLGLLDLDIAGILQTLSEIMPREVTELIGGYLTYVSQTSSRQMLWFGLVFSIYFPMRAANCLMRSVRKAYHLTPPTKPLAHVIKTLLFTVLLIVTIILSLVLMTVGDRVSACSFRSIFKFRPPLPGCGRLCVSRPWGWRWRFCSGFCMPCLRISASR